MIIVECVYIVVIWIARMLFSARLTKWAIRNGINGPEERAKEMVVTWRLSEVAYALITLSLLWWIFKDRSVLGFWIATAFTIVFGGTYILGSLSAALTIRAGSQVAYLKQVAKRSIAVTGEE